MFPKVPTEEILQFRKPPEEPRGNIRLLRLGRLFWTVIKEDAATHQG